MKIEISPIERFIRLLKEDKADIWNVYIYAIFQGLVNLSIPLGIQAIVNLIQGGQVSTSWIVLVIIVVAGVLLTGILQVSQMRIIENLQQKLFVNAAFDFTFRLPRFKATALIGQNASELMNRFFDTVSIQKGLSKVLLDFSTATLQIVFGLVLLAFYHPFFIFFGLGLFLLLLAIFRYTGKKGLESSLKESKFKYRVVAWLEDMAKTRLSFSMAHKSELPVSKMDAHVHEYLDARENHFKVLKLQYIFLIVFKAAVAAGLLLIGGILVLNQEMNIGQFIAAEIIILLVINSVEKIIISVENVYDVMTSLEKIGHVTDIELEKDSNGSLSLKSEQPFNVDIRHLLFSYPGMKDPVLQNLDLSIKEHQHTYLSGEQGSGKTTLMYLLAGIYRPASGTICFNGLPMDNYDTDSMKASIGTYFKQEAIFDGTLAENISLGRQNISQEDLSRVSEKLKLNDFIQSQPKGFDTLLGPNGCRLSNSIAQKILLARAIVHNPKLLLLESGIDFMDEQSRKAIADYLFSDTAPWTIVSSANTPEFRTQYKQTIQMKP